MEVNRVIEGDCLEVLKAYPDNTFTACVTDPPYGLSKQPDMIEVLTHWLAGDDYKARGGGFMGKSWDSFVPGPATWREVYRMLKPGATLLCFAGQRTQDLMGVALRLAGFEIFDCIMWVFGTGFPKSHHIGKGIDRSAGKEREVVGRYMHPATGRELHPDNMRGSSNPHPMDWGNPSGDRYETTAPATPEAAKWESYGSAIKPAYEPILCARKPNDGTFAQNAITHGIAGLNIDGCRVEIDANDKNQYPNSAGKSYARKNDEIGYSGCTPRVFEHPNLNPQGRFPPNLLLECNCGAGQGGKHAPDCVCGMLDADSGDRASGATPKSRKAGIWHNGSGQDKVFRNVQADSGGASRYYPNLLPDAARFKYSPKAPQKERGDYGHPTQKPLSIMAWLCTLVKMPEHNLTLDPFAGTGTTAIAAIDNGMDFILIEQDPAYAEASRHRIAQRLCEPYERPPTTAKTNGKPPEPNQMSLF